MAAMCIVVTLATGARVSAAPQILGLVATTEPTTLTCENGVCAAEFSAFCLQKHRTMPVPGTAYRPADGTILTLTITGPDGVARSLPAGGRVMVDSRRDYNAVRIAIPESEILSLGGRAAAIAVGERASLVPLAQPGDPDPLGEIEIATVTGPLRATVASALADDGETAVAAQIASRLINALPAGRTTAERRRTLWRRTIGDTPPARPSAGFLRAEREYRSCRRWADTGLGDGLRRCLEEFHDGAVSAFTRKAWALSEPGS